MGAGMRFSCGLAVALGIVVPIAETVRRWSTWRDAPMSLFDDYILAGLLLSSVAVARREPSRGQRYLAAAWGIVCGVGYCSVFGQMQRIEQGIPDPAPIPSSWVLVIKGILWALAIAALVSTLYAKIPKAAQTDMQR
jgi:hypothetical protein